MNEQDIKNYTSEPVLTNKGLIRYLLLGFVVDLALVVFLFFRMSAIMLDADNPLHIELPPVISLLVLGLVLLFSLKTLTVWRKSEGHPKRVNLRSISLALLGSIWIMFLLGLYIESALPYLNLLS